MTPDEQRDYWRHCHADRQKRQEQKRRDREYVASVERRVDRWRKLLLDYGLAPVALVAAPEETGGFDPYSAVVLTMSNGVDLTGAGDVEREMIAGFLLTALRNVLEMRADGSTPRRSIALDVDHKFHGPLPETGRCPRCGHTTRLRYDPQRQRWHLRCDTCGFPGPCLRCRPEPVQAEMFSVDETKRMFPGGDRRPAEGAA